MFLYHALNFCCDMLWSPRCNVCIVFWWIILSFSIFPIALQLFFPPKYISLISKNEVYKKERMNPDLFSKIGKSLIDPLKGPAPLSGD